MTEAERLDAFEHLCRKYRPYPEALTQALVRYLKGEGSLDLARQEWQAALKDKRPLSMLYLHPSASEQDLDALDLRALDLYRVTDVSALFLYDMAKQARITAAFDYLLSKGATQQQVLRWAVRMVFNAVDSSGQLTALGRYLLPSLPAYADQFLKEVERWDESSKYTLGYASFVRLLLAAQPPYVDLAWQIAQRVQHWEIAQHRIINNALGSIATSLLQADPARFTPWVRALASPSSPAHDYTRVLALRALLSQNGEQHIDLALEAARTPLPAREKYAYAQIQITGLQALMRFDPVTYWPLLEEAVISPNAPLASQALKVLAGFPFDQACPTLQHCVAKGKHNAPLSALEVLLNRQWDGQEDYALSLLAHHSKPVQGRVIQWVKAQGDTVIDGLAPFLAHHSADARLATVQALAQIGGQWAASLLAARLDAEKALRVRAALLDAVGVPACRAAFQGTPAHPSEALIAEAEAMLSYVSRPALAWFDVQAAPALHWTTGSPVPPPVLRYLLFRQSRTQHKDALDAQVSQALVLIDRSASGDLALALYHGWASRGAAASESWLLPLVCALADDRLAPRLRRQIERWVRSARRTLAVRAVRALAMIESEAALDELTTLVKQGMRGKLKAAIRQALAEALASGQSV